MLYIIAFIAVGAGCLLLQGLWLASLLTHDRCWAMRKIAYRWLVVILVTLAIIVVEALGLPIPEKLMYLDGFVLLWAFLLGLMSAEVSRVY